MKESIKALLVDDDEDDYTITRNLLFKIEEIQFELDWTATYEAALERIKPNRYDIYLIDYRLGERSGLELMKAAFDSGCKEPVIILTGQGDRSVDLEAMEAGAADYLVKGQINAPLLERSIRYSIAIARRLAQLRERDEHIHHLAAIVEYSPDAIISKTLGGNIATWNASATNIFGYSPEEAMGRSVLFLFPEEEHDKLLYIFESIKSGEQAAHYEMSGIRKDGAHIFLDLTVSSIRDSLGRITSAAMFVRDITDKKRMEAQLLRMQKIESIGALASGIAHDLNNILTPVPFAMGLLKRKESDRQNLKLIETVESCIERGAALIKQILSFARGTESKSEPIDLKNSILEVEKIIKETFPRSIRIRVNIPANLSLIKGDASQLHQALTNLCINARDAMPKGGALTIAAENRLIDENYASVTPEAKPGHYVAFAVSDAGEGIPPEIIDKIFDPFFTTKEFGKGSGLGLFTTIGIVRNHNGFIEVKSEPGLGTEFTIYLPADDAASANTNERISEELPLGNGETILVVDDEELICRTATILLEEYNYNALTANNGAEAIALYVENRDKIRAVLTDMDMPSMGGDSTIRALRRIDPKVKIIIGSGAADKTATDSLEVDAVLAKPYSAETLIRTLHSVLKNE